MTLNIIHQVNGVAVHFSDNRDSIALTYDELKELNEFFNNVLEEKHLYDIEKTTKYYLDLSGSINHSSWKLKFQAKNGAKYQLLVSPSGLSYELIDGYGVSYCLFTKGGIVYGMEYKTLMDSAIRVFQSVVGKIKGGLNDCKSSY